MIESSKPSSVVRWVPFGLAGEQADETNGDAWLWRRHLHGRKSFGDQRWLLRLPRLRLFTSAMMKHAPTCFSVGSALYSVQKSVLALHPLGHLANRHSRDVDHDIATTVGGTCQLHGLRRHCDASIVRKEGCNTGCQLLAHWCVAGQ